MKKLPYNEWNDEIMGKNKPPSFPNIIDIVGSLMIAGLFIAWVIFK